MDFADVEFFEFDTADTVADNREDYGEVRQVSTGYLHGVSAYSAGLNVIATLSVSFH